MSVKLLSFAFSTLLQSSEKLVLLAICDSANEDDLCWPSLISLSKKCSMSVDGISRIIKRLEAQGYLSKRKRFGRSTIYKVCFDTQFRLSVEIDPESNKFRSRVESIFDPESKEIYEPSKKRKRNHYSENRFEEWWSIYPKQRAGSKDRARSAYEKALTRELEENIHEGTKRYCRSDEVARGFAKGAAAWLNDDRWNCAYSSGSSGKASGPTAYERAVCAGVMSTDI